MIVIIENKSEQNAEAETLPSRRSRHPKPLSFLEKPAFSRIVFILFILIIGGIFIYFTFLKDKSKSEEEGSSSNSAFESNLKLTNDVIIPPEISKIDNNSQQPKPIPVVTFDQDKENIENINDTKPVVDENKSDSILTITHKVVSGDNLYQISKKYYGSFNQEYIKKIMEANNLVDTNINLNSTLVIPDPINNP